MPATVRLDATTILTMLRRKEGPAHWLDAYRSTDNGRTWRLVQERLASTGGSEGNASSLTRLRDGRLALTYGYRAVPFGMRARVSRDGGVTWGDEITLRDDAGCWDQVEVYVARHSEVSFSHGVCPECLERELSKIKSNPT